MGSSFPIHPFKIKHELHKSWSYLAHRERVLLPKMDGTLHLHNNATWQCRVTSERRPSTCLNLDHRRVDFPWDLGSLAQFQYVAPFAMAKSRYPKTEPSSSPRGQRSEVGLEPLCVAGLEREWRTVGTSPEI